MLNFKEFLNENYNEYAVGDTVLIRYWLSGDISPVKILEKPTKNYYVVTHKVEGSNLFNAPDHGIKPSDILGMYKGINEPLDSTKRYAENPTINPNIRPGNNYDAMGIQPGRNSISNDISF
jgi:hypothetical protein